MVADKKEVPKSSVDRSKGQQKKTKRKYDLKKIVMFVGIFAVIIYAGYALIWQQFTISQKDSEIDALQQKINAATEETDRLKQELEEVSDPEYLERVAREKLGLVRPNERVFVDSDKGN